MAAAVAALSTGAYAGDNNVPKGGDSGDSTAVAGAAAGAVAGAAAGAISGSAATGGNASAVGGGAVVSGNNNGGAGGAGGRSDASASSSLGSLNKFGGDGGSVVGSGNSSNLNSNTNLLGQGQMQAAVSDQSQSQSLSNTNSLSQGNTQTVGGQQATNTTNVDASDRSVTTYEAQARNPVNTAYAAPISIGGGVCVYTAAAVGGSGVTLSLSGSVAKRDEECDRRAFADLAARLGDTKAARALLRQNPMVDDAYKTAGTGGDVVVVAATSAAKPAATAEAPAAFSFTPMQPIPNPKTPRGE